jgi:hypothetical protein
MDVFLGVNEGVKARAQRLTLGGRVHSQGRTLVKKDVWSDVDMSAPIFFRSCPFHSFSQGCQIVLGPNIPKREKYTKGQQTAPTYKNFIANGRKL